jgi:hypothetical protein
VRARRSDSGRIAPEFLAGWVFADIMIVLFFVGLGSAAAPEAPRRVPKPHPAPRPKRPRHIVGMKTRPAVRQVSYSQSALLGGSGRPKVARRQVCLRLRKATAKLRTKQAATVLIFGGGQDIGAAIRSARAVSRQLRCARGGLFMRPLSRAFWDGRLPAGRARVEIFLFTTSQHER